MHPSQMSGFRKTIITLLTITFAGALLVFTAKANLALLMTVYPDPGFYMFGLLALEGGVVYWTGYYLLHLHGVHKAIAVFALAVDAILSGTGFFYEMENVTKSIGTVSLPPVVVIVAFAVVFNVAMSIICHLLPSGSQTTETHPKESSYNDGYQAQLAQTVDRGPGLLAKAGAAILDTGSSIKEIAQEKREKRRQAKQTQAQPEDEGNPVIEAAKALIRPNPDTGDDYPENIEKTPMGFMSNKNLTSQRGRKNTRAQYAENVKSGVYESRQMRHYARKHPKGK